MWSCMPILSKAVTVSSRQHTQNNEIAAEQRPSTIDNRGRYMVDQGFKSDSSRCIGMHRRINTESSAEEVALRQQLRAVGIESQVFSYFGPRVYPRPEQHDQVGSPAEPNNEGR